jgi:NAD(P)-dependent dehydrogenase (short-subunit alcohol dehydrogenase family)
VDAAAARVRSDFGHPDVLVNNAGTAAPRVGAEELTGTFQDRNGPVPW